MQTPKFSLLICALTVCGGLALHAQDTPAQAAARQALEQKMKELDANPPSTPPAASAVPSAEPTAPAAVSVPIAPSVDDGVVMQPVNKKSKPADAVRASQKSADKKLAAEQAAQTKAKAKVDAQTAVAKKAAAKKQAEKAATKASQMAAKSVEAPAPVVISGKNPGLNPIPAPTLPIPATKQEKLQSLLEKYKADQISPEEYHQQRASILAEP